MLRAILNRSWRQHPTRHQLYGHLPPITKTIQVRPTRHAWHCWRSADELISDVLLWTPTHGRAKAGRPARTYIQQLCEDTGCCPEDLPRAMNDREKWRERVRDIRARGMTWWWWWFTNPSAWARCDTKSVSKWSSRGLTSKFSFFKTGHHIKIKELSLSSYLSIYDEGIIGFVLFSWVLALCEMQTRTSCLRYKFQYQCFYLTRINISVFTANES